MYIPEITSSKNSRIKAVLKLDKPSERRTQGLFVVEGMREIIKAVNNEYEIATLFFCRNLLKDESFLQPLQSVAGECIHVSSEAYNALAYRKDQEGVIAVVVSKYFTLHALKMRRNPLIIVLENVEKPGNLGAILRSADAANADAILLCNSQTDIFNPNVIRASLGCVFTRKIVACTTNEALQFLQLNNIPIAATLVESKKLYYDEDLTGPLAIVMGTEAAALSDEWVKAAEKKIKVPMLGEADSLNVSVCLAIVLFESIRQRLKNIA